MHSAEMVVSSPLRPLSCNNIAKSPVSTLDAVAMLNHACQGPNTFLFETPLP